ncbi:MAG: PAS domain-containing protein, partial [Candidatus Acidiferrales bacterium]
MYAVHGDASGRIHLRRNNRGASPRAREYFRFEKSGWPISFRRPSNEVGARRYELSTSRQMSMQPGARSESAYRDMLDSLPSMVWLIDASGECLFQNQATLHFTGQSLRQEPCEDWRKRVAPEDVFSVEKSIAAALEENAEKLAEFRYRHASGEYHWMRATVAPANGKVTGRSFLLVMLADISADRAALETQQRTASDRAQELG